MATGAAVVIGNILTSGTHGIGPEKRLQNREIDSFRRC